MCDPSTIMIFRAKGIAVLTVINGVQAIGDSMAVQQISHREHRKIDYKVVQGTLYGDALSNVYSFSERMICLNRNNLCV